MPLKKIYFTDTMISQTPRPPAPFTFGHNAWRDSRRCSGQRPMQPAKSLNIAKAASISDMEEGL